MSDASKIYGSQPLPEWVEWVAADDDGCVWGFSQVPDYDTHERTWKSLGTAIPLGPVLPREISDGVHGVHFPDEGNGQLWAIESDPDTAAGDDQDDALPAVLICGAWLAFAVLVLVVTGTGKVTWAWLAGVLS
jgi:hypothetical protein